MIYKVLKDQNVFDTNPDLLLIDAFASLKDDRHMKFVILVADYESPLSRLPEKRRREKAAEIVGYPLEDGKRLNKNGRSIVDGNIASVEKAIAEYRKLQYDEQKEALKAYDKQIQDVIDLMNADKGDDPEKAVKVSEKIINLAIKLPELMEARKKLKDQINSREEIQTDILTYTSSDINTEELSEQNLSTLDKLMMSKAKKEE